MMERTEKMTEAMGTEGRQATLPRLSVTHWLELGSLQGRVRMPRIMRKRSSTRETLTTPHYITVTVWPYRAVSEPPLSHRWT